jgi:hypothetical protein
MTPTWKERVARGEKYTPPKLTPEEERKEREGIRWHAQKGLWDATRALEHANSKKDRERALRGIAIYKEMLEKSKEPEKP